MDHLLSQFSLLSDEALTDKNFDPKRVEDLMAAFEQEAMASWAAMEAEADEMAREAEASLRAAEAQFESLIAQSMMELESLGRLHGSAMAEMRSLVNGAEAARKMGKYMMSAPSAASRKYADAAVASSATVKSAWVGGDARQSGRIHPN
ncbi:uncharacterized protein LOC116258382 [Nymphaea colorata]|uniref:Uncharacterized protein n=1 Tax=Nymphaea colorata TaxID=210225 RepID=A0A5K1FYI8_9MAGN|nr:uncharacterized protein LOC116258382 [Nymphaea colorata]